MDNRQFNVNGETREMLSLTLNLAFLQRSDKVMAAGWVVNKQKGLILLWHVGDRDKEATRLPAKLTATECVDFVWAWLKTDEAKQTECTDWDEDHDHDGSNELGWRVYCEGWGHVASNHYAIVAIKPVYLWYGK